MPTVTAALAHAVRALSDAGIDSPMNDARQLLAHAMGIERGALILAAHDALNPVVAAQFHGMISARAAHKPVAQIRGWRAFWGRRFQVTPDVLDPRPDSETLIEVALSGAFDTVLDLGTGSGALIVTLLAERPSARGVAVDLSPAALAVSQHNAATHGVSGRLDCRLSDWFAAVDGRFELIICNPPYIDAAEWELLAADVRDFEPKLALTPGPDGLAPYRHIASRLAAHLDPSGRAVFEIGHQQGAAVRTIFRHAGFHNVACIQDINGKDRVIVVQN